MLPAWTSNWQGQIGAMHKGGPTLYQIQAAFPLDSWVHALERTATNLLQADYPSRELSLPWLNHRHYLHPKHSQPSKTWSISMNNQYDSTSSASCTSEFRTSSNCDNTVFHMLIAQPYQNAKHNTYKVRIDGFKTENEGWGEQDITGRYIYVKNSEIYLFIYNNRNPVKYLQFFSTSQEGQSCGQWNHVPITDKAKKRIEVYLHWLVVTGA